MAPHQNILVTGSSSGIGMAIAKQLLTKGYGVIGVSRRTPDDLLQSTKFSALEMDLSNLDNLPDQLQDLVKTAPVITAAVCCAGQGRFGCLEEFSFEQIRSLMDLNFTSQAYVTRALLPNMKKNGFGHLIYIGSEAALSGGRRGAIYSASKFALRGMAQSLREECAHNNIRVTILNPGIVKTEFFDDLSFRHGEEPENYIEPDDVAEAVLLALETRHGTVIDEINLSPLKKVIRHEQK
jgi:short-subunit dehydrogenase